jgi:hypothetical protein
MALMKKQGEKKKWKRIRKRGEDKRRRIRRRSRKS